MTIEDRYFNWMIRKITNRNHNKMHYGDLLKHLYSREFEATIAMDENRAQDGMDLRYRFGAENGIDELDIEEEIDDRPCMILEMMVALALRCEEEYMEDSDSENRTAEWFWEMIESLGLIDMTNDNYICDEVDEIIDRFLDRDYSPDGRGGLFTLRNPKEDLRYTEIWYQCMAWLVEQYGF